ncbi:hypothetical protein BCV72DRAFT_52022 [Rhizopus microsporus var. microsporus]|uniref:WHIM2 domain-containing protein n=2 Tax=Rhizopus microsporus TaxID=58291 RepID=A0A2G4T1C3_RHIZD|nr:uncharacterized protein RHIMIDRAFT_235546 [Rhizopus microsporus ATCC 52813]ORE09763.1 hypothetical protein BCV72DRAFT_52022 [Rhizopus microsporus var. microsporus]PHZ14791.1 hypothetical protein RHIMIDRAFT_235546 [Rhizopus microsporus ATCC 52813]
MAKEETVTERKPKLQQTTLNFFLTKRQPTESPELGTSKKRRVETSTTTATTNEHVRPPPKLTPIQLIYSQQEIWIRLQIREFMFRFGHLYDFDHSILGPLQNVQGDWRMKRFGATIVWKCLVLLRTGSFELSTQVIQRAKMIINKWMQEKDIHELYDRQEQQDQALAEALQLEGMTVDRWKDMWTLLKEADENIPELTHGVKRVTQENELGMILKLLELLLFEKRAHESLVSNMPKEKEVEHKKETKEYQIRESNHKAKRKSLMNKMHQLECLKQKENELTKIRSQIEDIETCIRDECTTFHSKRLEFIRYQLRLNRRMQSAGHDRLGNEYWIFSDLLDQAYRNSEPYWAYGIVIIGPGFGDSVELKWWSIEGKKEMETLSKWLKWHHGQEIKQLIELIHQRIDYLNSLEWAIYGEGFFS